MAHQIDHQKGFAAFASLKQEAWHGLGKVIETEMSVAEAIKFAGLDFIVDKRPNIHRLPGTEPGTYTDQISDSSFFTYRTDTNFVLGNRLGSVYQVVQNEEALGVCDELVKEGGLIIESAGSLFDGRTVFMCCSKPDYLKVGGTDNVKQYLVIAAGHDGGTPVLAYYTDVRVVCNNTLQLSLAGATQKHSIRHTVSAKGKLETALKLMGLFSKNSAVAEAKFNEMAQTQMKQEEFWGYLSNVFFSDKEIDALGRGEKDVISTRKKNIMNDVIQFSQTGIGQKEAGELSRWWAYNAVTGYYSNKPYDDPNDRMQGLLFGGASQTMEKALMLAADPTKMRKIGRAENTKMLRQFDAIDWSITGN